MLAGCQDDCNDVNNNDDDDEADLPLPVICVQRSTQEFYEQHKHEVVVSYLFDSALQRGISSV